MFSKLKEKLKNWTKKISEKSELVKTKEEPIELPEEVEEKYERKKKKERKKGSRVNKLAGDEGASHTERGGQDKTNELKKIEGKEKGFFKKTISKIKTIKISEKEFEIYADELEMLLLENNVAFEVTRKIIQELKEKIIGKELLKGEVEEEIKDALKEIIREILVDPFRIEDKIKEKKEKPYVILFCGINGSGKTTSVAKIADSLKKQNISCVIAAADTFRAAAIDQIKTHGDKIGVKVITQNYGADPAAVGFDAIQYAKKHKIDCVLIDTAGRMHTAKNLLAEIEKITKITKPDLKIFVGESITGNDAVEQIKSFNWSIGIDGIILSKSDIDKKGGTSLSVGHVTKKPILYLGTGQLYKEIEPFDKEKFIERLGL